MESDKGSYKIQATPANGKTWLNCDDIEVVITLDRGSETCTFKGKTTLTGIIKKRE